MPLDQRLSSAAQGVAFGHIPILWIVVNALWVYRMTVRTRHCDLPRRSLGRLSDDPSIQALVVAFWSGWWTGGRGLRETWPPALVRGIAFAAAQFAASTHPSPQLADISAALASAGALVAVPHARRAATEPVRAAVLTGRPERKVLPWSIALPLVTGLIMVQSSPVPGWTPP
jgi:L-lactate permease